jgi:hypothetical protein
MFWEVVVKRFFLFYYSGAYRRRALPHLTTTTKNVRAYVLYTTVVHTYASRPFRILHTTYYVRTQAARFGCVEVILPDVQQQGCELGKSSTVRNTTVVRIPQDLILMLYLL